MNWIFIWIFQLCKICAEIHQINLPKGSHFTLFLHVYIPGFPGKSGAFLPFFGVEFGRVFPCVRCVSFVEDLLCEKKNHHLQSGTPWDIWNQKHGCYKNILLMFIFLKNRNFQLIWWCFTNFLLSILLGYLPKELPAVPIKTSGLTGFFPGFPLGTCETWGSDRWIHHHPGREWHNGSLTEENERFWVCGNIPIPYAQCIVYLPTIWLIFVIKYGKRR